jgi:3-deoxy-manno-octulosonate cytidylyltransferase (CMP-KDO synthetase)
MSFLVIVPARRGSTRLPDKPLEDIGGKPMLVRVLECAAASGALRVLAAVDDEVLVNVVRRAGFEAVLTGECDSGSARVAVAADQCGLLDSDIVVNLQGDEPFMEPALVRDVAGLLARRSDCVCATVARPLCGTEEFNDPAVVKVIGDADGTARYFSRAPIPHLREGGVPKMARAHVGLYAYRMAFLRRLLTLSPAPTELAECLEQLRVLWHGFSIALLDGDSASFGIDTPADLVRARARYRAH